MQIIISFNVPELDKEARKLLAERITARCKHEALSKDAVINNGHRGSIDIDISKLEPSKLASVITYAKTAVKDILHLGS